MSYPIATRLPGKKKNSIKVVNSYTYIRNALLFVGLIVS